MRDTKVSSSIAALVLGLLCFSMLSMSIGKQRKHAQRYECSNNMKRLALGTHNYHSAYKQLPPAITGTDGGTDQQSSQFRLTGFAALLPFIEQQAAWEALSKPSDDDGFPAMGPAPSVDPADCKLWGIQFDAFICPADKTSRVDYGMRSYVMCYGDGIKSVDRTYIQGKTGLDPRDELEQFRSVARGAFTPGMKSSFRNAIDGLSNTAMFSETAVELTPKSPIGAVARNVAGLTNNPSKLLATVEGTSGDRYDAKTSLWSVGKGSRWCEGSFMLNAFTTVLPPGSPSGTEPLDPFSGCISASSVHDDGVFLVTLDGAVRFVSNSIDTGDLSEPSVCWENKNEGAKSPYGVWGALGTRANKEIIPSEREVAFKMIRGY